MRYEEAGEAGLALRVANQIEDLGLHRHVERAYGLIEDDESAMSHTVGYSATVGMRHERRSIDRRELSRRLHRHAIARSPDESRIGSLAEGHDSEVLEVDAWIGSGPYDGGYLSRIQQLNRRQNALPRYSQGSI